MLNVEKIFPLKNKAKPFNTKRHIYRTYSQRIIKNTYKTDKKLLFLLTLNKDGSFFRQ
jgi:hypothetical protein